MNIIRYGMVLSCCAFFLTTGSMQAKHTVINSGWKFSLESDSTSLMPGYDDNSWESVNLPHDWSIQLPFDREAAPGNDGGYLPGGTGWYRKSINLNKKGDKIYKLKIGGAYMDSEVFVNGKKAGGHPYGYSTYFVDITPFVKDGENLIAIKVDNSKQKNCRWYSGSGLYRDVTLIEKGNPGFSDYPTFIKTPDLNTADIDVFIDNVSDTSRKIIVTASIAGKSVSKEIEVPAGEKRFKTNIKIDVPEALPWSPEAPNLYDYEITLSEGGSSLETLRGEMGFRTIKWDAADGLTLNGKGVLLNGACVHHDNGILGAAAYKDAEYRRVRLLKEAGFNAVRTSHNVPSEHFLDACDKLGLLVIDEAFDGWREEKNEYDYHTLFDSNWQNDLDAMILRDRNHPSIFCWSTGNEIIERKKIEAVTTARRLTERCHQLDPTRPVTSALAAWDADWEIYDPLAEALDIVGYNYMIHKSESDHDRCPSRIMMQTESFPGHAWNNYRKAADHPYVIGDFVWTGIDYIGESGIGRYYYEGDVAGEHYHRPMYPWHGAYCGDIDLIGFRKPISHYRSMLWNPEGEQLHIAVKEPDGYIGSVKTTSWSTWPTFESWNWQGHEGKPIDVEVYSRYPKVRLSLNGTPIGEKAPEQMIALFTLPYAPGTLLAQGLDENGNVKETKQLSTAGLPSAIRIKADTAAMNSDEDSLAFINIEIVDNKGAVVPVASNVLNVEVSGPASLIALGNADIKDEDPYYDSTHKTWKGRALAVVRSNGKKGIVKVKVSSPGLASKTLTLKSR